VVLIPAGTFQMGDSIGDGYIDERPLHIVTLDSFAIGKYEITNGQYCAFLNAALLSQLKVFNGIVYAGDDTANSFPFCDTSTSSSSSQIAFSNNSFSVRTKGGKDMINHPMVMVSWYGAVAYCNWRSRQEGKQTCYDLSTWNCDFSGKGYRLPTEAEWEYAARGDRTGKRFSWGDTISHIQANYFSVWSGGKPKFSYDQNPISGFHPSWNDGSMPYISQVGGFPANDYGVYDMVGNVGEWCNDLYGIYSSSSQTNPTGPVIGGFRIHRDGGWDASAGHSRVSVRFGGHPNSRSDAGGFRVVLKLK
jgi:formylglycine-generating enzyme required for sulfatase activity